MRRFGTCFLAVCFVAVLASCAGGGGSAEQDASAETASTPSKPIGVAPPAGSPLAKVDLGMNDGQVRQLLGDPTHQHTYMTGKAWIPFYYGSDTNRTEWKYKGVGRVVFGHNRWSGNMKVIRVDYDPKEPGF